MSSSAPFTNRLANETSLYLKQHQHNPVDWYPWGPEALARARELDRPIFLSIGYSACHWCHVMEHESFENEEIARLLNESFISIKVDREERPDIDQIYMTAVQLLNHGQGGWPMSVFLTPDLRPFTGGTYFPPEDRYGRPGFRRVLHTVTEWWKTRRQDIDQSAAQLTEHIQSVGQGRGEAGDLDEGLIAGAVEALRSAFDPSEGGFGSAPKFPHPMDIRLLLRAWKRFGGDDVLHMALHTLERMAMGGIYDHLGGGFARYSTDQRWLVPHFEKMLYDNALLVPCYLEAYQITGSSIFREVAEETLRWAQREMTSAEGPFYSTLDADSEGVEGKFYVWYEQEIRQILGEEDAALFGSVYNVRPGGNWEGHNILHRRKSFADLASQHQLSEADLRATIDRCREKLLEVRNGRIWPGRDEKFLTSWNGLMIAAFAQAAQVLDQPAYAETATRAASFILERMRTPEGLLLRTASTGAEAKLNAYLEDYSFLADALISLYETDFDPRWIREALALTTVMIDQFWDADSPGFFYTGKSHETLITRTRETSDNAIPSGSSMAVSAMLRLAELTGQEDLRQRAVQTLQASRGVLAGHPMAAGQMLTALDFHLGPTQEIAIVGDSGNEEVKRVLRAVRTGFRPNKVVALKGAEDSSEVVTLLADRTSSGPVTTYICERFTCQAPLVGADAVEAALASPPRQ